MNHRLYRCLKLVLLHPVRKALRAIRRHVDETSVGHLGLKTVHNEEKYLIAEIRAGVGPPSNGDAAAAPLRAPGIRGAEPPEIGLELVDRERREISRWGV